MGNVVAGVRAIPFTQYKLPDGRAINVQISRPNKVADKAEKIIRAGYVFECEILTDGMVSLTITDPDEGDLDIEVITNGPEVPIALDRMIERFKL